MHTILCDRLLDVPLSPQGYANVGEINFATRILTDYCERILEVFRGTISDIEMGWIFVSGIKPMVLCPIASSPPGVIDNHFELQKADCSTIESIAATLSKVMASSPLTVGKHFYPVRLDSAAEFFGVLVLCSDKPSAFTGESLVTIKKSEPLMKRLLAEAVFNSRLTSLSAPLRLSLHDGAQGFFDDITARACQTLAADGSVLRLVSYDSGVSLSPRSSFGLLSDQFQLSPGSVFERICLQLFNSSNDITVHTLTGNIDDEFFGEKILDSDVRELAKHGIQTFMIMKLSSKIHKTPRPLGTLSVFHRLPQVFSPRDISLYKGFCERISNELTILGEISSERATNRMLQAQSAQFLRAEITALLGHDFGHKVLHLEKFLADLIDELSKKKDDTLTSLNSVKNLRRTKDDLKKYVNTLNMLVRGNDTITTFEVIGVFNEIYDALKPVFERYNMDMDRRADSSLKLTGDREAFRQCLFNLVLNSIDAHRAMVGERIPRKTNTIYMHCQVEPSKRKRVLRFKIWDEGPGISWAHFPNAQDIFEMGTTSKREGTGSGLGLPAARTILHFKFDSDLELTDRKSARFEFLITVN